MPELSGEELFAFSDTFALLSDAFSLALSENLNQAVILELPNISQEAIETVMRDETPVLQTTFSYPVLCEEEGVLVVSSHDAKVFVDLIGGGDGTSPPSDLLDDQMNQLADAMSGTISGLAISMGNTFNLPVQAGSCATALEKVTLPPVFATADKVVRVHIEYRIMDVIDSSLDLFLTPDFVRAILDASAPAEAPAPAPAPTPAPMPEFGVPTPPVAAPAVAAPAPVAAAPAAPMGGFAPFGAAPAGEAVPHGMEMLLDIPLDVTVELGRVQMLIKDILELSAGSIVELERVAGEPVDLLVNGRLIAKGEVVVIDDNFGIRIAEIISPADRLNGIGKR